MAKRKKENLTGNRRSSGDNPLAAARSRHATTTTTTTAIDPNAINSAAVDWVGFGTTNGRAEKKAAANYCKKSRKAEQIWHRRSGAGFRLFVDYYFEQPDGIVVSAGSRSEEGTGRPSWHSHDPSSQSVDEVAALPRPLNRGGQGRSRAALRRKKKRRQNPTAMDSGNSSQTERSAASTEVPTLFYRHDQLLYNGRLLDAWSSKPARSDHALSSEFKNFLTALSKPLPLSFRFRNQHSNQQIQKVKGLRLLLESNATLVRANIRPVAFDPEHIYQAMTPPRRSGASTDDGATHHPFPVDKASLKRLCPQYKEFLNEHTLDGTIARQELGSMLPVWLLHRVGAFSPVRGSKPKPLRVLDACASPGSKTLQVAELLSSCETRGRVRANDVNTERLESLKEAVRRSGFFAGSGAVDDDAAPVGIESVVRFSNTDASRYPIPKSEAKKYSVILCDVPCSGDGTCRKDVHIIPNWTPSISNALHSLQVKILARALRCVAIGGIVSYSTCSLNPIEDEAVVGAALEAERREEKFGFELMRLSDNHLNGLILRPGVRSWRVADFDPRGITPKDDATHARSGGESSEDDHDEDRPAELTWYESYQSAVDGGMEDAVESMWPIEKESPDSPLWLPLDRCLRLFPQDQDTGGFFVALIRRTK